jgi:hypothetical protein
VTLDGLVLGFRHPLNHPNICTLYDIGPDYLVMEYIDGAPLKGPLPLDQALKYAMQICDALDAARGKNITHRDLKPVEYPGEQIRCEVVGFWPRLGCTDKESRRRDTNHAPHATGSCDGHRGVHVAGTSKRRTRRRPLQHLLVRCGAV